MLGTTAARSFSARPTVCGTARSAWEFGTTAGRIGAIVRGELELRSLPRCDSWGPSATPEGRYAPTVAEWLTTYFDTVCERLVSSGTMAPRTLEDYRSKARLWIVPSLGRHRLDRLRPEHLDAAYTEMYAEGLSSSTVLKVHRILSRALTVAVRRDKVARNVAQLIDAPAPTDSEITPFSQTEARAIIDAARQRHNGARWLVALALGLRQGEAIGLRWSYLDLETGVIQAWFQVQRPRWQHGCTDANARGMKWHRPTCRGNCRLYRHDPDCPTLCRHRDLLDYQTVRRADQRHVLRDLTRDAQELGLYDDPSRGLHRGAC
jgi:hypothetical protein